MKSQWIENFPLSEQTTHYSYQEFLIYYFHHLEVPRNQFLQVLQLGANSAFMREIYREYKLKLSILDIESQLETQAGIQTIEENLVLFKREDYFDVVIDNHCLHCLSSEIDIERGLKNIYASLKSGGLFFAELMIDHRHLSLSEDFIYQDSKIYSKDPFVPLRWVPTADKVEEMLKNIGFRIKNFRVYEDLNFVIDSKERSFAFSSEPQALRLICEK